MIQGSAEFISGNGFPHYNNKTMLRERTMVVLATTRGEQTACCPGFGLVAALAAAVCCVLLRSAAENTTLCNAAALEGASKDAQSPSFTLLLLLSNTRR